MKLIYQTLFEKGQGNCLSAALASILEWELEDIPNFSLYKSWFYPELTKWLTSCNLGMIGLPNFPYNAYHLIKVKSPRIEGSFHELVGFSGKRIHDPHPQGNCEGELFQYDVLFPLNPSKPIIKPNGK